jgi:hypothetical protein
LLIEVCSFCVSPAVKQLIITMLHLVAVCGVCVQVKVAEVDSHKAFRMASDVKAVVVLLPHGTQIPPPYQLAASLKQKTSWDTL